MEQRTATEQVTNRRGVISSLLFPNPLEAVKWYFNPFGATIGAWNMSHSGSFYMLPHSVPGYFFKKNIVGFGVKHFGDNYITRSVIPAVLGSGANVTGIASPGVANAIVDAASGMNTAFAGDFGRALKSVIRRKRWATGGASVADDVMFGVAEKLSKKYGNRQALSTVAKFMGDKSAMTGMQRMFIASKIGGILTPVLGGLMIGELVGRTMSLAFKAGVSALDYASAQAEHMRALEFGGTLGAGFRSQSAATERQRAVQMLQRTHLGGRRGLGTEAATYAALL